MKYCKKLFCALIAIICLGSVQGVAINYPIRMAYIDTIASWWPTSNILKGLGVPEYSQKTQYNYIVLAYWLTDKTVDIVSIWADPVTYLGTDTEFGKTKDQIQKNIKKSYNSAGISLMISAFGSSQRPTTKKIDPTKCANDLANFVLNNNLDGVAIDWFDNQALDAGTGVAWLVTFQKILRDKLPNHIISHGPQSIFFKNDYKKGGYVMVDKEVGKTIDFYVIQFFNVGYSYSTYTGLFEKAGEEFASNTSVFEIAQSGILLNKIVVGKPVSQTLNGWVNPKDLGNWFVQAYQAKGWMAGIMYWEYIQDIKGTAISSAIDPLINIIDSTTKTDTNIKISTIKATSSGLTTITITSIQSSSSALTNTAPAALASTHSSPASASTTASTTPSTPALSTSSTSTSVSTSATTTTTTLTTTSAPTSPLAVSTTTNSIKTFQPHRITFVNTISSWWPTVPGILGSLGVPKIANPTLYNCFVYDSWLSYGASNVAAIWQNPIYYIGNSTQFGTTNMQIQKSLKVRFGASGIKVLVNVFGSSQMPTSYGYDANDLATKLASFVSENQLDGVMIDYQDDKALTQGTGQKWLINFHNKLKAILPDIIISHSPKAAYFRANQYPKGGYVTVHNSVGSSIDLYAVRYFDQSNNNYTYNETLFTKSGDKTSVLEISQLGSPVIPLKKIVVYKPVNLKEQTSGFITSKELGDWGYAFQKTNMWNAGVMYKNYASDLSGEAIANATSQLFMN